MSDSHLIELDALRMDAADFAAKYRHPFLVVSVAADDDEAEFRTIIGKPSDASYVVESVAAVAKRPGANQFSFISIGRTRNNDIVLDERSVSKSHAFIQVNGASFAIADAGSTNGTQLNGSPVPRHDPKPLEDGDQLVFSPRVSARFMVATSARAWLRRRAAR